MSVLLAKFLLLAAAVGVEADKDTDFYYSGFTNPNVRHEMYWKDAYNVLEDLDQFSALYITYHNCVHSQKAHAANSGEDGDNEGYDYWYMEGVAPLFMANSAFSLYGVLKDGGEGEKNGSYCHKKTYINSFFTNRGVETIAYPFGVGDGVTSSCDNGGDNGDARRLEGSFGLGCYDGQFAYGQFSGGGCTGTMESVSNTMDDLNDAMESLECVQIYDENGMGDDAYEAEYNDGDDGGRQMEEDEEEEFQDDEPLNILYYSQACRIELFGPACPDPYGLLAGYERALSRALANRPTANHGRGKTVMQIATAVLGGLGLILMGSALFVRCMSRNRTINEKDDALLSPEKSKPDTPTTPVSIIRSVSSSASKKAQKLKEKFQDFAEEEVEEEEVTVPEVNVIDTPEVSVVDSPQAASPAPDSPPPAEKAPSDESFVKVESPGKEAAPEEAPASPAAAAASPTPAVSSPTAAAASPTAAAASPTLDASSPTPAVASPAPSTTTKKKKKRPILNKLSKSLFGKKKKDSVKPSSSASV